jgi:hypothetical protein
MNMSGGNDGREERYIPYKATSKVKGELICIILHDVVACVGGDEKGRAGVKAADGRSKG